MKFPVANILSFFRVLVRLGEHDLSTDTETNHVEIDVIRVIPHPSYDTKDGHSDLAVLVLKNQIVFTRETIERKFKVKS